MFNSNSEFEAEKASIYLRNYEPSKERANRIAHEHKANMLERDFFNERTRIGPATGFLRKPVKSMEKHLPLKVKDSDDYSRITKQVEKEANASLCEGFDANSFLNPTWKEIKKERWKTSHGMSYSGQ